MDDALLQVRDLKKHFLIERKAFTKKGIFLKAVDGVSFDLRTEEVLGLVGESGSGKSTVAYTVIGMYQPTAGRILFNGRDIGCSAQKRELSLKKELQIVFQDPGSSLNPRRSIRQILESPLRVHHLAQPRDREEAVVELLRMVELPPEYMEKYTTGIGGGERQLVSIARAIAAQPKLLVLDEPTSALDVSVQAKILNTLISLRKRLRLSYLFITHDLSLMRNVADRVAIMYLGKICEIATTRDFFQDPLHPYTQMLLSSIPTVSDAEELLKPNKAAPRGEIPSPVNLPIGCSFHPRCPLKKDICSTEQPPFREIRPGHWVGCHLCG